MDESYGTYVDDEYYGNHEYDDNTDDDTHDDTDDDTDHKKDSYTAAGAAPDAGAAPTQTRPDQARPDQTRPGQTRPDPKRFYVDHGHPIRAVKFSIPAFESS